MERTKEITKEEYDFLLTCKSQWQGSGGCSCIWQQALGEQLDKLVKNGTMEKWN